MGRPCDVGGEETRAAGEGPPVPEGGAREHEVSDAEGGAGDTPVAAEREGAQRWRRGPHDENVCLLLREREERSQKE